MNNIYTKIFSPLRNILYYYIIIICVFLIAIAVGVRKKAYETVAPPIYDPIGYYAKSHSVWDSINKGKLAEVFTKIPTRPPGTVLILYPNGFIPSIKSFLFRSAFAPIAIWALALIIIILPKIKNLKEMLTGLSLTLGFIALPIFYHFEIPVTPERSLESPSQWGLVDVLEGSVGALALGFLYTGVTKKNKAMIIIAWIVSAYSFFIKPSGVLVMGFLFLIYLAEVFILCKKEEQNKTIFRISHTVLFVIGIIITIAAIFLAVSSGYLSKEVIDSGKTGGKVLIQFLNQSVWNQLGVIWNPVIGYWLMPAFAGALLLSVKSIAYSFARFQFSALALRFLISCFIFVSVMYWWISMAGMLDRYIYPFIMLIISWLILPTLFEWTNTLKTPIRYFALLYYLLPAFAIITLLYLSKEIDSSRIERFLGCNLDVGQYKEEVKIGRDLLNESQQTGYTSNIYSIGANRVGVVEMIDLVNSIEHDDENQHFTIHRVNDWNHPGIKIKDLISSDYFIIEERLLNNYSSRNDALRWQDEEALLANFISSSADKPDSGIRILKRGPVFLFTVTNKNRFMRTINEWVSSHKWSDDFWVRNSFSLGYSDPPRLQVIEPKAAAELTAKNFSLLPTISFGDKITLISLWRKSNIVPPSSPKSNSVSTIVYEETFSFLFRADQDIPPHYVIFIHLMDKNNNIIFQHDFQIDPDGILIPKGTIWTSLVPIPESELAKAYSIGFGAYIPNKNGTFLQSNCGQSDWNGNRVLLKLKK